MNGQWWSKYGIVAWQTRQYNAAADDAVGWDGPAAVDDDGAEDPDCLELELELAVAAAAAAAAAAQRLEL